MDEARSRIWNQTLQIAVAYLGRWSDTPTQGAVDDLAQDTALAVWRCVGPEPVERRVAALVRTISRRVRIKLLLRTRRAAGCVAETDFDDWPAAPDANDACLRVGGALVPRPWLVGRLDTAMQLLDEDNQHLVRAFYEGVSCRDLGERFGISEDAVKVRLHRCRALLRRRLEAEARAAGCFEP